MASARTIEELFEAIFVPYNMEISEEEVALLKQKAESGEAFAELCLILLDFYGSKMHYNFFNGTKDELDEIQEASFAKLDALGKRLPFAYKVAGDLHLGKMGKIVWHTEIARSYFEKYAEATGDRSIIDGFDAYTKEMWEEYKSTQSRQQRIQIRKAFKGLGDVTYSHDPSFYENLKGED
ncbi:MAG: hypothetical protein K6F32_07535 [Bacilli bacterium]|nr:hypothetical protein [Bacilli bacterium]